jgi:hypothetical protein
MPEQEVQQLKEPVELVNIEWITPVNAQPMDESLYEESELMQQLIEQPEKSGPEPEGELEEAKQAGYLPTPETTPAPEMSLVDTTPTETERAERAQSALETDRPPRGWTAVSADLRKDHIIDRRAVCLSHLDGGLAEMDTYGFNACGRIDQAPTERQASGVCTSSRDKG